ncbi:radical SAM protein [Candidatus Thorarchaeota archaeon]|nr:MAG: radical SAM protein [Candidatus Thorarchaeota archaeon]
MTEEREGVWNLKRGVKELQAGSSVVGELPIGCQLCGEGKKMVLFVTGICESSCFYCPLSVEKAGKDVVFADEMPVEDFRDILTEAKAIGAEGAGLSGGDPLCRLHRTLEYIRRLKEHYGESFHLHLYTSLTQVDRDTLILLRDTGLDEIRFHAQGGNWTGIEDSVEIGLTTGIELPVIPAHEKQLREVAIKAEDIGVQFLNLNELEASESNFSRLASLGMRLTSLEKSSIAGSQDLAYQILDWVSKDLVDLSVHYCSASFKDSVQMRNRLGRRVARTKRELEVVADDEPLLILGLLLPQAKGMKQEDLERTAIMLAECYEIPDSLLNVDKKRMRIEVAPWILEEIAGDVKHQLSGSWQLGIATEYPSWDRLQVEFDPL